MKIQMYIDPKKLMGMIPWGPHGKMSLRRFYAASQRKGRAAKWKKVNLTPDQRVFLCALVNCRKILLEIDDTGKTKLLTKFNCE